MWNKQPYFYEIIPTETTIVELLPKYNDMCTYIFMYAANYKFTKL